MRTFVDDAYGQDQIAPVRVEHRVEFGDRSDTGFGFTYNFLLYEFSESGAHAEVLHYLDEPDRVHLRVLEPFDLDSAFAQRVLVFLRMRFDQIEIWSPCGQESAPADDGLTRRIDSRVSAHMRHVAY